MIRIEEIYFGCSQLPLIMGEPVIEVVCEGSNWVPIEGAGLPGVADLDEHIKDIRVAQKKAAKWVVVRGGELLMVPECVQFLTRVFSRPLYLCTNGSLPKHFSELSPQPACMDLILDLNELDQQLDFLLNIDFPKSVVVRLDVACEPSLQVVRRAFDRIKMVCSSFVLVLEITPTQYSRRARVVAQRQLNRYYQLLEGVSDRVLGVVM